MVTTWPTIYVAFLRPSAPRLRVQPSLLQVSCPQYPSNLLERFISGLFSDCRGLISPEKTIRPISVAPGCGYCACSDSYRRPTVVVILGVSRHFLAVSQSHYLCRYNLNALYGRRTLFTLHPRYSRYSTIATLQSHIDPVLSSPVSSFGDNQRLSIRREGISHRTT